MAIPGIKTKISNDDEKEQTPAIGIMNQKQHLNPGLVGEGTLKFIIRQIVSCQPRP